ncbi:MAG: hypothetical protein QM767_03835 [Anaeromyxobacter sp.]
MSSPRPESARVPLHSVLAAELEQLRGPRAEQAPAGGTPDGEASAQPPADPLAAHFARVAAQAEPLSALCLSGGGIRSATFNLGLLQALARSGLLLRFDYLSTVSGGGYIGSWLQAWIQRTSCGVPVDRNTAPLPCPAPGATPGTPSGLDAAALVAARLTRGVDNHAGPRDPLRPEPRPVDRLREFKQLPHAAQGRRLRRHLGRGRHLLRNLLLNWLVMVHHRRPADGAAAPGRGGRRRRLGAAPGLGAHLGLVRHRPGAGRQRHHAHAPQPRPGRHPGPGHRRRGRRGPARPDRTALRQAEAGGAPGRRRPAGIVRRDVRPVRPAAIAFVMAAAWADTPSPARSPGSSPPTAWSRPPCSRPATTGAGCRR